MDSAQLLCGDGLLKVDVAISLHQNGAPGFYAAQVREDAEFFALRTWPRGPAPAIVVIDVADSAIEELVAAGATVRGIAPGRSFHPQGDELFLPIEVFAEFNRLVREGLIDVHA